MSKTDYIYFAVSKLMIHDANTEEYKLGEKTAFTLHGDIDKPLKPSSGKKMFIRHIQNNIYEIRGYVYRSYCDYALLNIGGIKISICNSCEAHYKPDNVYEGIISLVYDVWDCYHMNVCENNEDKNLYMEGITQEIQLIAADGSKHGTLSQTHSLTDTTPNEPSSYIIGVSLCEPKTLQKKSYPLQIDNNTLTLSLDGISDYKIKLIKEYIEKVCRLDK